MNWNPVGNTRADQPDKIVVGTGSARLFRAEVTISRLSGQTILRVIAGGTPGPATGHPACITGSTIRWVTV
jgi:hypothetical protein